MVLGLENNESVPPAQGALARSVHRREVAPHRAVDDGDVRVGQGDQAVAVVDCVIVLVLASVLLECTYVLDASTGASQR